jgi:hypothetical protein
VPDLQILQHHDWPRKLSFDGRGLWILLKIKRKVRCRHNLLINVMKCKE